MRLSSAAGLLSARWPWQPPGRAEGTIAGDPSHPPLRHDVGQDFPILTGAPSTTFYLENEQRLLTETLGPLAGLTMLKTDLWDEAKNTRILQWAVDQGAKAFAIDISEPIARQARAAFGTRVLRPAISDVRRLPFGDESFDAVYSMGTVEHFVETEASVAELARILKPGGRLILGVPNRHDPFLRPLMVTVLYSLGLYGHGFEKSYSRRALRGMVEATGLEVRTETGILFMPGWLRMLDLWCHTRARPLTVLTGALIRPFAWLDRRVPALRRHGYLIVAVGEKPVTATTAEGASIPAATHGGVEHAVDAHHCDPAMLSLAADASAPVRRNHQRSESAARRPPDVACLSGHAGITGAVLLAESHLTIHTHPKPVLRRSTVLLSFQSGLAVGKAPSRTAARAPSPFGRFAEELDENLFDDLCDSLRFTSAPVLLKLRPHMRRRLACLCALLSCTTCTR